MPWCLVGDPEFRTEKMLGPERQRVGAKMGEGKEERGLESLDSWTTLEISGDGRNGLQMAGNKS